VLLLYGDKSLQVMKCVSTNWGFILRHEKWPPECFLWLWPIAIQRTWQSVVCSW